MARRRATAGPARVIVAGDVHGEFELLAHTVARVAETIGTVDAVLAVGDVEANRDEEDAIGVHAPTKYRRVGDFPYVAQGILNIGAPLYFIGGNHEPWPALDAAGPGRWSEGAYFLGRAGVADVVGFQVAYLSGIYSPRVTDVPKARRTDIRDRGYYTWEELHQVRRAASRRGSVDFLLTHDWPSDIAATCGDRPIGRPELRQLCTELRPRWHFCGHMHYSYRASIGTTDVVCLGHIRTGPQGFAVVERDARGEVWLVELTAPFDHEPSHLPKG